MVKNLNVFEQLINSKIDMINIRLMITFRKKSHLTLYTLKIKIVHDYYLYFHTLLSGVKTTYRCVSCMHCTPLGQGMVGDKTVRGGRVVMKVLTLGS